MNLLQLPKCSDYRGVPPFCYCVSACCGVFDVMVGVFLKLGLCRVFFSLPTDSLSQVLSLVKAFLLIDYSVLSVMEPWLMPEDNNILLKVLLEN